MIDGCLQLFDTHYVNYSMRVNIRVNKSAGNSSKRFPNFGPWGEGGGGRGGRNQPERKGERRYGRE
jgi:hypothetical protein